MTDSGTASNAEDPEDPDGDAGRPDAGRPHPVRGPARYARAALIAGLGIAMVCAALLVIIFFLDTFNATVYSVGGADVSDATDEARAIRDNYAAVRTGSVVFLAAGVVLAAGGGLIMYRHRNEPGDGDGGEDVEFADLVGG